MVNWEFFDNQTPSSARDLVDGLRAGDLPAPTRGAPLCSFRETARTLAGLPDSHSSDDSEAGAATLAGLRIAHERGMAAPEAPTPSATVAPKSDPNA
jgi:NADH-quinone oxidoreductase subunit E